MVKKDKKDTPAVDPEIQALAKHIEKDLPYEKVLYINEARRYIRRSVEDILEAGRLLLVIQSHEGHGNFGNIVEEEIGIPRRTAYRYMNAAIKSAKYPGLDLCHMAQVGKVYALLEAPEEELQKFEQLGLFGDKDQDDVDAMSVKELRAHVRDLKGNKEKYVAKELKKLREEKEDIERERDMLRRKHPEDMGTWVTGMRPILSQSWENFLIQWRDFVTSDQSQLNDEAQDFMIEFYDRIYADLDSIDETRYGKTGLRYGRKKK